MHTINLKSDMTQADAIAAVERAARTAGLVVTAERKDEATGEVTLFLGRPAEAIVADLVKYDVIGLVRDAFGYLERVNPKHYATFFKQRPAGSQWGLIPPTNAAWAVCGWEAVPADQLPAGTALPACSYYRSTLPLLLADAVEQVGLSFSLDHSKIFLVTGGSHGPYLATTEELPKLPATEAWLIIGPASKEDSTLVPWTAFPGRMAATIPPTTEKIEELDLNRPYAVKYISKETAELCC